MKNYLVNGIILVGCIFLSLELMGYVFGKLRPDFTDQSAAVIATLNEEGFQNFLPVSSTVMGWQNPKDHSLQLPNCNDELITYRYNEHGLREYTGYDPENVTVILAGDSYTNGDELADDDTISSQIYQQSRIVTANLGVNGYDPVQAFLRVKEKHALFPDAKVVVIGIMYENIWRMVNQWRALISRKISLLYSFKPYMRGGEIQTLDPAIFTSFDQYKAHASIAAKHEYWAQGKPAFEFPYSYALWKVLSTPYFWRHVVRKMPSSKYGYYYRDKAFGDELLAFTQLFAHWAKQHDMTPVVVFIPADGEDTTSPQDWMDAYKERLPENLVVRNIDLSQIDKEKYNLKPNECHPSPYGAGEIARQYILLLNNLLSAKPSITQR